MTIFFLYCSTDPFPDGQVENFEPSDGKPSKPFTAAAGRQVAELGGPAPKLSCCLNIKSWSGSWEDADIMKTK